MDRQSSILVAAKRVALVDELKREFTAILQASPCAWWDLYTTADTIISRHRHPKCPQWLEHPANIPGSAPSWPDAYAEAVVSVAIGAHAAAGLPFIVEGTDLAAQADQATIETARHMVMR